MNGRPPRQSRS
uniref:Uncharacterized protein n=1 Tax=Anguilla anguilla TaxID=7936 RepID=A0A0E9Q1Z6_ANGAN